MTDRGWELYLEHLQYSHAPTEFFGQEKVGRYRSFAAESVLDTVKCNRGIAELINNRTPPLGDGQSVGGAGDLVATLPNEVWALVAERVWPERALLELGWTCQLLRACCLTNYVAHLRYGPGRGDWRQIYREAWMAAAN